MRWPQATFSEFLKPNKRPYMLGPTEDAKLVGMRWYGLGPFFREHKSADKIRKKSHFVIRSGDVIYNKLFAWKGAFGLVPDELDGFFVSDKFPTYELNERIVDRRYLFWYFHCADIWEQAKQLSTGSAAISKLTLNPPKFMELTIPLPEINEQKKIVARIEQLDFELRATQGLHTKTVNASNALLASHLDAMLGKTECPEILGKVLLGKPQNGWSATCDNAESGIAVLSLGAITGFEYSSSKFKRTSLATKSGARYWLKENDFLVTRSNTPELVGHAAIYNGRPSPCIYPDLIMRVEPDLDRVSKEFLWYWMQTPRIRDYIRNNAKGTSPTMKKISQATIMEMPFPTGMTLEDQRELCVELGKIKRNILAIKKIQSEREKVLNTLLPSFLYKAFGGEL